MEGCDFNSHVLRVLIEECDFNSHVLWILIEEYDFNSTCTVKICTCTVKLKQLVRINSFTSHFVFLINFCDCLIIATE